METTGNVNFEEDPYLIINTVDTIVAMHKTLMSSNLLHKWNNIVYAKAIENYIKLIKIQFVEA